MVNGDQIVYYHRVCSFVVAVWFTCILVVSLTAIFRLFSTSI